MNVLEVQDALKDFSQEQLVKEMQMPSGQAPQFLVLSELNRRQRMKQDFEARQAQQQPTVAEKLVAAAGAPQGGIGAMAQAMAPQTDMAMNTGIAQMQEPMSGEAMGMSGGGTPFVMPTMQQLEEMARQQGKTVQQLQAELTQQSLNPVQKRRASRNAPNLAPPPPPAGPLDLSGLSPREQRLRQRSARVSAGLNQGQDEAPAPRGVDIRRQSRMPIDQRPKTVEETEEKDKTEGKQGGLPTLTSGEEDTGTITDRIMDLMEQRQKSADMDKYLALAQAGFALMQPAEGGFGEALGKAGLVGIQAYQDASDRYQTGLADVLDTEIALQKATAAADTTDERIKTFTSLLGELQDRQMESGEDLSTQIQTVQDSIFALIAGQSGALDVGSLS